MSNQGFKRISISVKHLRVSDIEMVLRSISDVFDIQSVRINCRVRSKVHRGPVPSTSFFNQLKSDPDHPSFSKNNCGGGSA